DQLARGLERDGDRDGEHRAAQLIPLRAFEAEDEKDDPRLIETVEVVRPRDRPEGGDIESKDRSTESLQASIGWCAPQRHADAEVVYDEQPESGECDPLGRPRCSHAGDRGRVRRLVNAEGDAEPADTTERALGAARAIG